MGDGPPGFRRNFTCSAVLRIHSGENASFDYRAVTSYGGPFQTSSSTSFLCNSVQSVLQPQEASLLVWAGHCFAHRYSGNRICLLFLRVLRCFSSPGLPSHILCIQIWIPLHYEWWVSPFGNLRIKACLQLPEAYRCSSRPSSAPSAKASTVRPF